MFYLSKIVSQPMKSIIALLVVTLLWSAAMAQTTKRKAPVTRKAAVTTPQPQPTPTPQTPRRPTAPASIVIVNGQTFTTAALEPALRQELETLEDKIADARRQVLEVLINTLLLQAEAKKRGIDTHRLYQLEVTGRAAAPTAAEIKKFVGENSHEFAGVDPATANQQAAAYLREEAESNLADELVKRLRKTHPVVIVADINSATINPSTVVATIAGQPLKADSLLERLKPIIYNMRIQAYEVTKRRVDQLVDDMLLLEEAKRRQIGPEEIIRAEVSDKVLPPTEEEVARFYNDNKARISGDLNSVRNQVANYLQEQSRQTLEQELSARLRKTAQIRWVISEPIAPVQNVSVDNDPARGEVNAPVTIIEFTDFQCPACAAMHPVLEEVVKSYGNKVRFVVRDFPLQQHEWARKAAEAANAANAQGKFFEYIAILFKNQKALDVPSLKKYASELGLNRAQFDAALDRGVHAAEVQKDVEDGQMYGVSGTPSIFINGVRLRVLSPEALKEAIERAASGKANSSH